MPTPHLPSRSYGDEKAATKVQPSPYNRNQRLTLLRTLRTAIVYVGLVAFSLWCYIGFHKFRLASTLSTRTPFHWSDVIPTTDLIWHPCFDSLECARLQVPLDWTSPSDPGTVALALTKVPAIVPETDAAWSGPLLLNPGGPGGSGVEFAITLGREVQAIVGRTHSVIGFDPRGINNTTPATTCFPSEMARMIWWLRGGGRVVGYSGDHQALGVELARARSLGKVCKDVINNGEGGAAYAGTPNVARDMLAIVDAAWKPIGKTGISKRGLRYWGFSYGTALGQTFATMFPDRVERVVLDGVVDLDDYYAGGWRTNLQDSDLVIESFFAYCASSPACPLTAATPSLVARRLKNLVSKVRREPVAVYGGTAPDWVTEADVRTTIFWALYTPVLRFPIAAEALAALEDGDGSKVVAITHLSYECDCSLAGAEKPNTGSEADFTILCQDGGGRSNATLAEMTEYVDELKRQSKMIGGNWARIQMACTGWQVRARGLTPTPRKRWGAETKNPILFVSTKLDPVTPLRNAEKARKIFPGSGLLVQESEGHCSISAPSACSAARIGRYFDDGVVDGFTVVCEADMTPWGLAVAEEKAEIVRKWRPTIPGGFR